MQRYFLIFYLLTGTINVLAMKLCDRQFYRQDSDKWVLLDKGLEITEPSRGSRESEFSLKIECNLERTKPYVMFIQDNYSCPIQMSSLNTLNFLVQNHSHLAKCAIRFCKNREIIASYSNVPIKDLLSLRLQLLEQLDNKKEEIEEIKKKKIQKKQQQRQMIQTQTYRIYGLSFLSFILLTYIFVFT